MKKLKSVTSAPARLSAAMPLLFGLATIAAAPTVEAVSTNQVDIIGASIDVNENGVINAADDLNDVALWCSEAAPTKVDIIDGRFDVNESGAANADDDLLDCDLNDENGALGVPTTNQVDIRNGAVDVNENGFFDADDNAANIVLFVLP